MRGVPSNRHSYRDQGILVVGLTFPVVPKGDETLRFQLNAAHTEADVDYVLNMISEVLKQEG